MSGDGSPTSRFASTVPNPFRRGKQYQVFELLRLGCTREGLLIEIRDRIGSRDHRSLLDTTLHRIKIRGIDVLGGSGKEVFRLVPGEGYEMDQGADAHREPSTGARAHGADSQPSAGGQRAGQASRTADSDQERPASDFDIEKLREPVGDDFGVTLEDITDIFRRGDQ